MYYTVLLRTAQDYKALQSTAEDYKALQRSSRDYNVLDSTTKQDSALKVWIRSIVATTYGRSATLGGATFGMQNIMRELQQWRHISVTLRGAISGMQNTMELRHSCLIVAAHETSFASSRSHPPTSPNTAPGTTNDSRDWSSSLTLHRATEVTLQNYQILHAPATQNDSHESPLKRPVQCGEQQVSPLVNSPNVRLRRKVTVELHQVLHLPCHEKWPLNFTEYYFTLLFFTLLFFYSSILWLYYSSTLRFFSLRLFANYCSFTLRCRPYIESFSTKLPLTM